MRYSDITAGRFIARPNRFIALVELDGRTETVHVKNTGRCRELLVPGAEVYLAGAGEGTPRKTRYDLVAVRKGGRLINMDSQAPNAAVKEWLLAGNLFPAGTEIRPEFRYGDSRFDFAAVETRAAARSPAPALLEVKGVTLVETRSAGLSPARTPEEECSAVPPLPIRPASPGSCGGPMGEDVALFPDAPTQRGTKHLRELAAYAAAGGRAWALFVIQTEGVEHFAPNEATDPAFAAALRAARDAGVHILAYDCRVAPDSMELNAPVEVRL